MTIRATISLVLILMNYNLSTVVSVGTDTNCDYNLSEYSIQDIIDIGETNINVTSQSPIYENFEIKNTLILIGGFVDCIEANNEIFGTGNNTEINGGFLDTVIKINAPQANIFIQLSNLHILNGLSTSASHGGGIDILDNNDSGVQVLLEDSIVSNSSALFGGGI